MLSQDDQRRLDAIERELMISDPIFATGLRDGTPRAPADDRRWPIVVVTMLGLVVLSIGLLVVSPLVSVLGSAGVATGTVGYRMHLCRAHGAPRGWRRRRH